MSDSFENVMKESYLFLHFSVALTSWRHMAWQDSQLPGTVAFTLQYEKNM
jgi:hypothetical protein